MEQNSIDFIVTENGQVQDVRYLNLLRQVDFLASDRGDVWDIRHLKHASESASHVSQMPSAPNSMHSSGVPGLIQTPYALIIPIGALITLLALMLSA